MKCPHCNYEDGFNNDTLKTAEGESGDFYELPVKMERTEYGFQTRRVSLYACPECSKTFID